MSIIGVITVFRCDGDGCHSVCSVHTDAEIESFATRWYSGYERHFCPVCRQFAGNRLAIAMDEAEMDAVLRRLDRRCEIIPQIVLEQEVKDASIIH